MGSLTPAGHIFEDAEGRTWRVVLTCRTVIECERVLGVKLLDLFNPDSDTSQEIDDVTRLDVFAFIVRDELARHGVSAEELERSLTTADHVKAAWQAFHNAVLRFLPDSKSDKPSKKKRQKPVDDGERRSLHDAAVLQIWNFAGWCQVEPWSYTLAELKEQAIATARHSGRSATARAASESGAVVMPLNEMTMEQKRQLFRAKS